ncbi:prolyl-tRNA synthetase [Candidatus Saccharibacteria bacterium]|nr:prolyl-tRNA synthetase [Candidatus Saccharibacteria bacterium]MBH1972965.1 prolyl-tRNA synthetase [Candidatus Saccharibacteria bacterium]MBH1991167.1 prolyl-tRNA synthetase [Candidatus Saccharibacteria bacterium]
MRISQLFTKTSKSAPADEVAKNAQLLIRAGYVYKVMAGVYAYTPLGLRVLENIKQVVREEMNAVNGQELIMTNLQPKETWQTTGRWDDDVVDVWFKTQLKDETEIGLAWSHEEAIMEMMQQFVKSYKDLPTSVYQFQTKLRNELRAKSGIMRGREFVMKDMYSLHASADDLDTYYNSVIEAYKRVYTRLGLGDDTYVTFASGGAFTKFSHEFQTICDAGEDILYVHREKNIAVNEEVLEDAIAELGIDRNELEKVKSAEVGNIFNFGSEKSEQMNITVTNKEGQQQPIYLASYGIGITRVMGVIVEKFADEKGIVWPESVAPAKVYLVRIGGEASIAKADELYADLKTAGIEVLYDDRDERPGAKFADAELMGIPYRVTVSDRLLESDSYEYTVRSSGETQILTREQLHDIIN